MRHPILRIMTTGCVVLSALVASPVTHAQSDLLRASQRLSGTLADVPAASVGLLQAGAEFSVAALRPVGASVEVVLVGASEAGRFSLVLSREALEASGVVVGTTLVATAVSGGVLLWAGSELVAFLLDPLLAEHHHRRELQP
jgi:hypothetical protein